MFAGPHHHAFAAAALAASARGELRSLALSEYEPPLRNNGVTPPALRSLVEFVNCKTRPPAAPKHMLMPASDEESLGGEEKKQPPPPPLHDDERGGAAPAEKEDVVEESEQQCTTTRNGGGGRGEADNSLCWLHYVPV